MSINERLTAALSGLTPSGPAADTKSLGALALKNIMLSPFVGGRSNSGPGKPGGDEPPGDFPA